MSDNKEILYTETSNYKLRKDSPDNYYDVNVVNDNLDKLDTIIKDVETKNTNVQSDWNITNTASSAFIKNKPTTLPANGGNADTVDGKHADDFAPSGFGLGTFSKPVSGDWNNYIITGFYHGSNLTNQPPTPTGSNGLWQILAMKFSDDRWCTQLAFNFENPDLNYIRKKVNTVWSAWQKISDGGIADTIKNTLPISKGGTGATDVVNALKNLNLLNYNFSNPPSCSALVYKTYSDFGIASTTMHGFFKTIPEYSFFVFENVKTNSAYITDAPYNTGVIHAFKGYKHDCHALFFSGQGDNGSVYHYLANSEVVITNWTKLNDGGNADTVDGKHAADLQNYNNLTNKPTSFPANGGNADTVDGKHANDFATSTQVTAINSTLNNKVDKVAGKDLSTNDFTAVYKTKLDGISTGAKPNVQSDWNVTDINSDAFIKNKPTSIPANGGNADTVDGKHATDLQNYNNLTNKPTSLPANGGNADTVDGKHANEFATVAQMESANNALNNKVDKVAGKDLSTNDFTTIYKNKLDGVQTGAAANIQSDWNVTDTSSDAFIKNKPQDLINKTELPTMCPKGFYIEYSNVNLEPNSWYRIAANTNRVSRASGFFVLNIEYDMAKILENHIVFAVSNSSYGDASLGMNPKISVQTNSFVNPIIDKMRIATDTSTTIFLDIKTTAFKVPPPIKARLYLNFMGVSFKYFENIEKVEATQDGILLEIEL